MENTVQTNVVETKTVDFTTVEEYNSAVDNYGKGDYQNRVYTERYVRVGNKVSYQNGYQDAVKTCAKGALLFGAGATAVIAIATAVVKSKYDINVKKKKTEKK